MFWTMLLTPSPSWLGGLSVAKQQQNSNYQLQKEMEAPVLAHIDIVLTLLLTDPESQLTGG